jgi:hypothetical protein
MLLAACFLLMLAYSCAGPALTLCVAALQVWHRRMHKP